jgi:hypothetical protein
MQAKMAQQGKQMRVGAREGFAYDSVKLVLLANGNRYEVDSDKLFHSGKALYPFRILHCPNSDLFWGIHSYLPIHSLRQHCCTEARNRLYCTSGLTFPKILRYPRVQLGTAKRSTVGVVRRELQRLGEILLPFRAAALHEPMKPLIFLIKQKQNQTKVDKRGGCREGQNRDVKLRIE